MKPASQLSDRAKRYRANRTPPPGPRRCNFCASRKNVDVDHITGDESEGEPENLMYLCRPCNTSKAVTQARNHIGIRTRQYNPQPAGFKRFTHAAAVLLGIEPGDAAAATTYVRNLSPLQRRKFSDAIAKRNPEAAPTFQQYVYGVTHHRRGAKDEGGAIIHATPAALRSQYAGQIARLKTQRRGEVPF